MSVSSMLPPSIEGVQSSRGHVGHKSGLAIYARALAILRSCPYVRVSLQNMVLRKKTYEVGTRYLVSDIQADILAWLGVQ